VKPHLRFKGVALRRGGRLLFENLDLALGPGEALHVTGPNGSGKSSLIRLAAGLLRPERGQVERTALALADDNLALDRELPLIAALHFWVGPDGSKLEAPLNRLNLAGLIPVPVRLLSAGQRKRATLARVAASGAPLWLLDEPANGLDSEGFGDLVELIDAHTAAGGAVVAASHLPLPGEWRTLELGQGEKACSAG
jgi:heme exporter protein A